MSNDSTSSNLEVIPPSALEAITRGEVDTQIRTAKEFPRSMKRFLTSAIDKATSHPEVAESFIYVRPVGKKNGVMQYAEGLSVRAAEIVGSSYGNLRVGSMIVEQTERYVITRGYAHDLESNFASTSENKEPTVKADGTPFSEAMRAVVAKASLAKARRDATFQVVPRALCRPIETAARALIAGDAKSLDDRRTAAVQYVQRLNIDLARIWAALGINGEEELTSDHLMTLTGIRNSIKDGDTTIDEAFPKIIATSTVGSPKKTVTEQAAEEKEKQSQQQAVTKTEEPPQRPPEPPKEPAKQSGPSSGMLISSINKERTLANVQKSIFIAALKERKILGDDQDKLEDLDQKALADLLDLMPEIVDAIKNPGASA